jgi:phage terminase large subunit GpA-like protein
MTALYDRKHFRDAGELVGSIFAEALTPAPAVDLVQWTERNIVFGPGDPFPGPYSFERFPFFRRILECLGPEHPARTVTFRKSAQIGGTILGDAFLLGWLDLVPSQLMCVHPTLPQARAWVNNKIKPAVRNSEGLQAILSFDNPKDVKATELLFERLDARGGVIVTGANSAASLSQHSVKAQLQDDLAKWEQNDAGDPEGQADSRSRAFEDAKIFKVSTPMVEGECRIDNGFKKGSQEHYHVPCPHCGHLHPLEWQNMQANIDARGSVEGAYFNCPACGGIIEEKHRQWMVDPANGAAWVAHNPEGRQPSFTLWSAYAPLSGWARIGEEYLTAKGDTAKEQTFANDVAGLAFRRAGEAPEWEHLKERAQQGDFRRGRIAAGYYFVIAGADVQDDRVEIGVWAFGPDLRRQALDHIVVGGKIADEETKRALDKLLKERTWPDAFGNARGIEHLFMDAGYEREAVLDFVARHPASLITPIVGATSENAPVMGSPQTRARTLGGRVSKDKRLVFPVGGGAIKSYLYGDLRKGDPLQRGFVALPQGFDDGWFEQLSSERRARVRSRRGFWEYRWTLPAGKRNEVLDCAVYAYAAAERLGWKRLTELQWQTIAAERDRAPDGVDLFTVDRAATVRPALAVPAARRTQDDGGGDWLGGRDYTLEG